VDHKNSDEAALVRRVQARDEMAFREIVERYQAKVFSIIYGILRNHNDAEDIAQQVFAKIYFSIQNFDFRSSLLTWIYKITVNECYDYLRKKRVRKLVYESDFSVEDAAGDRGAGGGSGAAGGPPTGAARSGVEAVVQGFGGGSQPDPAQRGGGPLRGRAGRDDRIEREYNQSKVVPDPPKAIEGRAAAGADSWDCESKIAGGYKDPQETSDCF
jgi:RNA polymerase sigma factor (sigma-70 family)